MSRGRPRLFDEKKALTAAMGVFWQKGCEGASCEELLTAMEMNPGSMYAAFGDKQKLYDQAFDLYCDTVFAHGLEVLEGPGTALAKVRKLVQSWGDFMSQPDCKGCFIQNTLIEFSPQQEGVAKLARQILKRVQTMLETQLVEAAATGELSQEADPTALAAFLVNTVSGLNVMARAGTDAETIGKIVNSALLLLR